MISSWKKKVIAFGHERGDRYDIIFDWLIQSKRELVSRDDILLDHFDQSIIPGGSFPLAFSLILMAILQHAAPVLPSLVQFSGYIAFKSFGSVRYVCMYLFV